MNIIADIAGQYDALLRLVDKMPKDKIVLLGDLVDRGSNSKEVIQWAIDNEDHVTTLLGNHEHMMIDYYEKTRLYDPYIWHSNGGGMTGLQYIDDHKTKEIHVKWLKNRDLYCKTDELFISHAAWASSYSLEQACNLKNFAYSLLWNRDYPVQRELFQIMGHNSHWGLKWFGDKDNPWAVCLDASKLGVVTGMHWPSKKIYQEPYLKGDLTKPAA